MLTAEIAILRAVEEAGIRSQVNAGLSLGEYGALVASGVMKEEDAFTVVRKKRNFLCRRHILQVVQCPLFLEQMQS